MLAGVSACGGLLCAVKRSRPRDSIFVLICFTMLFTMSAIRYDVGYDYSFVYAPIYERILNDASGEFLAGHRWEPGFKLLLQGLMLVTENFQGIFVITSLLIILLVMAYFWLFSPNPFISVFLFVALSHYYCSMNFVRQTLAAAVAMFAFPLLKRVVEKRCVFSIAGYFAVVLLASSFHMSALLLILFFFINLIPVNKYVLVAYVVITAVIYFNTYRIIDFVTQYWYQYYGLGNIHMQATFALPFTITVAVVFIILFMGSGMLKKLGRGNYLYVNYAFFTLFFILMGTRHSVLDRLSLNFALLAPVGISILVCELSKKLREEKVESAAKRRAAVLAALLITIFGGGLAAHHYALVMDHHGVVPYQIIFKQPFYQDYVEWLRENRDGVWDLAEPYSEPEDIEI